ncbi:hypothetical protein BJB45_18325 [Halomonas huangheensis]|uniref:Uncharacterized protein n=1 Tax=Halomonas huangheensis TaxID=1178482 RepID=W1ND51_9GAMM|nr:hypothetical protein BJB45_18325 [Halomonas huangheensis]
MKEPNSGHLRLAARYASLIHSVLADLAAL